jgi:hypothetical protein
MEKRKNQEVFKKFSKLLKNLLVLFFLVMVIPILLAEDQVDSYVYSSLVLPLLDNPTFQGYTTPIYSYTFITPYFLKQVYLYNPLTGRVEYPFEDFSISKVANSISSNSSNSNLTIFYNNSVFSYFLLERITAPSSNLYPTENYYLTTNYDVGKISNIYADFLMKNPVLEAIVFNPSLFGYSDKLSAFVAPVSSEVIDNINNYKFKLYALYTCEGDDDSFTRGKFVTKDDKIECPDDYDLKNIQYYVAGILLDFCNDKQPSECFEEFKKKYNNALKNLLKEIYSKTKDDYVNITSYLLYLFNYETLYNSLFYYYTQGINVNFTKMHQNIYLPNIRSREMLQQKPSYYIGFVNDSVYAYENNIFKKPYLIHWFSQGKTKVPFKYYKYNLFFDYNYNRFYYLENDNLSFNSDFLTSHLPLIDSLLLDLLYFKGKEVTEHVFLIFPETREVGREYHISFLNTNIDYRPFYSLIIGKEIYWNVLPTPETLTLFSIQLKNEYMVYQFKNIQLELDKLAQEIQNNMNNLYNLVKLSEILKPICYNESIKDKINIIDNILFTLEHPDVGIISGTVQVPSILDYCSYSQKDITKETIQQNIEDVSKQIDNLLDRIKNIYIYRPQLFVNIYRDINEIKQSDSYKFLTAKANIQDIYTVVQDYFTRTYNLLSKTDDWDKIKQYAQEKYGFIFENVDTFTIKTGLTLPVYFTALYDILTYSKQLKELAIKKQKEADLSLLQFAKQYLDMANQDAKFLGINVNQYYSQLEDIQKQIQQSEDLDELTSLKTEIVSLLFDVDATVNTAWKHKLNTIDEQVREALREGYSFDCEVYKKLSKYYNLKNLFVVDWPDLKNNKVSPLIYPLGHYKEIYDLLKQLENCKPTLTPKCELVLEGSGYYQEEGSSAYIFANDLILKIEYPAPTTTSFVLKPKCVVSDSFKSAFEKVGLGSIINKIENTCGEPFTFERPNYLLYSSEGKDYGKQFLLTPTLQELRKVCNLKVDLTVPATSKFKFLGVQQDGDLLKFRYLPDVIPVQSIEQTINSIIPNASEITNPPLIIQNGSKIEIITNGPTKLPSFIKVPSLCPQVLDPVICENGKTYPNKCAAEMDSQTNCRPTNKYIINDTKQIIEGISAINEINKNTPDVVEDNISREVINNLKDKCDPTVTSQIATYFKLYHDNLNNFNSVLYILEKIKEVETDFQIKTDINLFIKTYREAEDLLNQKAKEQGCNPPDFSNIKNKLDSLKNIQKRLEEKITAKFKIKEKELNELKEKAKTYLDLANKLYSETKDSFYQGVQTDLMKIINIQITKGKSIFYDYYNLLTALTKLNPFVFDKITDKAVRTIVLLCKENGDEKAKPHCDEFVNIKDKFKKIEYGYFRIFKDLGMKSLYKYLRDKTSIVNTINVEQEKKALKNKLNTLINKVNKYVKNPKQKKELFDEIKSVQIKIDEGEIEEAKKDVKRIEEKVKKAEEQWKKEHQNGVVESNNNIWLWVGMGVLLLLLGVGGGASYYFFVYKKKKKKDDDDWDDEDF